MECHTSTAVQVLASALGVMVLEPSAKPQTMGYLQHATALSTLHSLTADSEGWRVSQQ